VAFQIKDFSSISASIINYAKAVQNRLTDFSIGSIVRTMLDAVAVEIEELYQQMFIGLKEAIPVAIYNSFDFSKLPAVSSTGIIRVTITSLATDTLIAAGTTFKSSSYSTEFLSLNDATIPAGQTYVDVQVSAKIPGVVGNVAANTTFTLLPAVQDMVSAIAMASFTSGRDQETDAQRKVRFAEYILTLNHGTVAALKYGLKLVNIKDSNGNIIESVRYSAIIEPYKTDPLQPIALVKCYIHNGTTGASSNLLTEAEKIIYGYADENGVIVSGWSAAGVQVDIEAASNVAINVTSTVTIDSSYDATDTEAAVQAAIAEYVNALDIGGDVIRAEITAAAMGVPGVINFALTLPASDTVISNSQKAVIGSFA
jgi:uncharacterized phage protein gp47/JayE